MKLNKGFAEDIDREATYDDIHELCRTYFNVPESTNTYLGLYNGKKVEDQFTTVENFAKLQNDKKNGLHYYLFVPISYGKLQFKAFVDKVASEDDDSDFSIEPFDIDEHNDNQAESSAISSTVYRPREIFTKCSRSFTSNSCIRCEQVTAFEERLRKDKDKKESTRS